MRATTSLLAALLLVSLLAGPAVAQPVQVPPHEYVSRQSPISCTNPDNPTTVDLWKEIRFRVTFIGNDRTLLHTTNRYRNSDNEYVFEEKLVRTPGYTTEATSLQEVCEIAGF